MNFKKIISLILAVVMTICTLSFADFNVFADVITTQEIVPGVDDTDTLLTYPEFNSKVTDGAFVIPGLMSAASYNKSLKRYAASSTMCPQAMCKVGHYTLITAYDSSNVFKSVVYVLNADNILVKTLVLPDSYHVGGIAYDSANQLILITKGNLSALGVISLEDFNKYMKFSNSFVKIEYTIEENDCDKYVDNASGVTYKNGLVYITNFNKYPKSYAYCYTPVYDKNANEYKLYFKYKMNIPNYTQGLSFTRYKGKLRMFASVAYGRNETKNIYCSYLYTYTFDDQTGNKTLDNILSCPPMFEYTYAQGGKLYCLFESASDIYRNVSRKPISYVMPIKLSAVCDEKKGSILNITTTNVENGKYVNASCTKQGADVYYSTSVPYIKKGSLSSGYLYPNGYLKQNTSMVYAVAVVDGRIIACDSIYISVGTALAPSKLKVTKKTKNSVSLSWKKASSSTSYAIYRSTSKKKNFKKVATVSGSKSTYKDTKLKKNKKYYYKIRAIRKGYINSSYTSTVNAKTLKK